jgi:pSer/pThr/pTyr-binding forkhead associated (FHA) protein
MSAAVTLTITNGPHAGQEFVIDRPMLCAVGRGSDCAVRLPNDVWHMTVSRRHCLLEISPPEAYVCDLGSRNGTYVNGESIGQRRTGRHADDFALPDVPDHPLHDGDELRVGDTVFRVGVAAEDGSGERVPGGRVCEAVC